MVNIDQIRDSIGALYKKQEYDRKEVPLEIQAKQLSLFAGSYIAAAAVLDRDVSQNWPPQFQLTGHAVELVLKACIASAKVDPPRGSEGHNLVKLYKLAQEIGFELDESECAAVVHLSHHYFQDLSSDTKFKLRYPTDTTEPFGGVVPKFSTFVAIVSKLSLQGQRRRNGQGAA